MDDADVLSGEEAPAWAQALITASITAGRDAERAEQHLRRQRALQHAPVETEVYGAAQWGPQPGTQVPATGPLLLSLGGPEVGRKWIIRAFRVCDGGNAQTAVTGKADFYVGQATAPTAAGLAAWVPVPPGNWRWTFPNLPNIVTFTSDSQYVNSTDNLFCVITGGTATQNILAAASIKDIDVLASLELETI